MNRGAGRGGRPRRERSGLPRHRLAPRARARWHTREGAYPVVRTTPVAGIEPPALGVSGPPARSVYTRSPEGQPG